jgi:L-aminopeptidase/D-esterase-like protein
VPFTNTTIGVVLTGARLSKTECYLLAQSGHTGVARSIHPAHSRFDGDAMVALATGSASGPTASPAAAAPASPGGADIDLLRAAAAETVAAAVRSAVSGTAG